MTRLRSAKGRKVSSTRWLERQLNDPYVKRAKAEGYRSRAAYKLLELDEKFGIQLLEGYGAGPAFRKSLRKVNRNLSRFAKPWLIGNK